MIAGAISSRIKWRGSGRVGLRAIRHTELEALLVGGLCWRSGPRIGQHHVILFKVDGWEKSPTDVKVPKLTILGPQHDLDVLAKLWPNRISL